MAQLEVSGLDGFIDGIDKMADQTEKLTGDVLNAMADVAESAIRRSIMDERLYRSGKLQKSIKRRRVKVNGSPGVRIGPAGEHHRYLPSRGKSGVVSAGYVGYIGEYGIKSRGIKGREWLHKGVEKSRNQAFDAADAVCDKFIKDHNL